MTAAKRPLGGKGRSCDGKRAHATRARAAVHVRRLVANGAAKGAYEPYECDHCDLWHVGHRPERERRGRRS